MSWKFVATKAVIISLFLSIVTTANAMASTVPGADIGSNLSTWLSSLGRDLLIPIAGLFGIAALFRRDIGHALVIVLIAIIVGIFVYDPAGAENIIQSVANTLTK